ncbi:hypothetical protein ATCC90586_007880 [Pythium insidiosum]|nr:hypothetical protein ATCC90586_007880 [Pythium insidiosum]
MRVSSFLPLLLPIIGASAAASSGSTTGTTTTVFPDGLNDHDCVFDWATSKCAPAQFCSFQFQFGDVTFSQACRLVPETYSQVPQQLHLAFAGAKTGTGMTISWTTFANVSDATVWVGSSADALEPAAVPVETQSYFQQGNYKLYTHHATLSGLTPATTYYYKVGSKSAPAHQSAVNQFRTARTSDDKGPVTVAVYGDFGVGKHSNATVKYVNEKLPSQVDFVLHIGDVSYADNAFLEAEELLGFFYEETYNRWMTSISPAMKTVPYMVLVGNHEAECHSPSCFVSGTKKDQLGNYTAYNTRFKMPSAESGGVQNMWFSFDHGPVHYTAISSETDFPDAPSNSFTGRKYGNFGNQLAWLEADLKKATANRDKTPWIVIGMHRAIYTRGLCEKDGTPRDSALAIQKAFEDLFIKYKVDVVVAGHQHLYERQYPIKQNKPVLDGVSADKKTYKSPQAPVYIVTGSAGNTEGLDKVDPRQSIPWNAVTENLHFGMSMMNATHESMTWTFVSSEDGAILDEFTILKA